MLAEWPRKAEVELKALSIFLSENGQERLAGGSGDEERDGGIGKCAHVESCVLCRISRFSRLFPFFSPDFLVFPSISSTFPDPLQHTGVEETSPCVTSV